MDTKEYFKTEEFKELLDNSVKKHLNKFSTHDSLDIGQDIELCEKSKIDKINDKNKLSFIKEFGFNEVGIWNLNEDGELYFTLFNDNKCKNILYAFVVDNDVKYIGKTTKKLKERMGFYKSATEEGSAGSTNKKNHKNIKELLKVKKDVAIYIFNPLMKVSYKGIEVVLPIGLEDSLIALLCPDWNDVKCEENIKKSNSIKNDDKILLKEDIENAEGVEFIVNNSNYKLLKGKWHVYSLESFEIINNHTSILKEYFKENNIDPKSDHKNTLASKLYNLLK